MGILIHDCDPTLFCFYRDPDDSLALGFGIRTFTDDPKLMGITTVFGNAGIDTTFRTARRIVRVSHRDIPVLRGSPSRYAGGRINDAVRFIIYMAKEYGEIEILATGPLTNIASALILYPELQDCVRRILIMGGSLYRRGNIILVNAEFNFWADPRAAKVVVNTFKNVVIFPLDITMSVRWGRDIPYRLIHKNDRLAKYIGYGLRPWAIAWGILGGFNPHDTIAAVYLSNPNIYSGKYIRINITKIGETVETATGKRVYVVLNVGKKKLKNTFFGAFS